MGKSDNIKRARRLKEAKQKREQDIILRQRILNDPESGVIIQNKSKVKYSELFTSFVSYIIDEEDSFEIIKLKYFLAMNAWNLSVIKEFKPDMYDEIKRDIYPMIERETGIELLEEMQEHKKDKYSEYKVLFESFDIKKIHGFDYNVTVVVVPVDKLPY
ncbi:MAG TPA: hypothetical protein VK590_14640 [Saprospiraceae bacterium]|nr:hypothetical protein [Saprospiraceae bacterium]